MLNNNKQQNKFPKKKIYIFENNKTYFTANFLLKNYAKINLPVHYHQMGWTGRNNWSCFSLTHMEYFIYKYLPTKKLTQNSPYKSFMNSNNVLFDCKFVALPLIKFQNYFYLGNEQNIAIFSWWNYVGRMVMR